MIMYADGFKYWLAYKKKNTSYFRCARYKSHCPGRCVVEDGKMRNTTQHDHPAEPDRALVDRFRKALTQRAAAEKTELYKIYWDEATQRHSEAALLYGFPMAESAMRKARRNKQLPQIPNSIKELSEILTSSELFRINNGTNRDGFYQATISLEDATCVIFMHKRTLESIGRIEEMHVDTTFHIVPQNPPNYYLFSAHSIQPNISVPFLYAIMTVKSQAMFAALFAFLREQLSAYILPNIIMSEFDSAMQSALNYTFPEAIIKGSWFHYTEGIIKQMKYFNLQRETTKGHCSSGLKMLLVLPLLPADYMGLGLDGLRKWMKEKNVYSTEFSNLCDYAEQKWLRGVGAEKMSIFGLTHAISDHVQFFNKDLRNMLGIPNPTVWHMLETLTNLATKTYVKITKRKKTVTNLTPKKTKLVIDTIIKNATEMWIRNPVHLRNPLQFLQLCSHCIQDVNTFSGLNDGRPGQASKQNSYLMKIINPAEKSDQQQYSMITVNEPVTNTNNGLIALQINSVDPPPLAFFPKVRKIVSVQNRNSEPPPLVRIGSKP